MTNTNNEQATQAIIEKIQKIIALAESTDKPGEMEAAAQKVERLLARHGLSMAEVKGATLDTEKGAAAAAADMDLTQEAVGIKQIQAEVRSLCIAVASIVGSRWYRSQGRGPVFYGDAPDVAVSVALFEALYDACKGQAKAYVKDIAYRKPMTRSEQASMSASFRRGFADRVEERAQLLADERRKAVSEARLGLDTERVEEVSGVSGQEGALMLVRQGNLAKAKGDALARYGSNVLGLRTVTHRYTAGAGRGGTSAFGAGRAAGGRVGLGTKGIK